MSGVPRGVAGATWIGPGRLTTIAGRELPGGMLYVGQGLPAIAPYRGVEPALINPRLSLDRTPDPYGTGMGYWPAYHEIPPSCRTSYLDWLAGGRQDPDAYIGYVFLFFYGLERRALHELGTSPDARPELLLLAHEARRLIDLYPDSHSFQRYARSFYDLLRLLLVDDPTKLKPLLEPRSELPYSLQMGLGQLLHEGRPVPWEWALSWCYCHPETTFRTPAIRCATEFQALFRVRYRERYGEGLQVARPRTRLKLEYQPASASFGGPVTMQVQDLPDVARLTAVVGELRRLAQECETALDGYSRWLGRYPDDRHALPAVQLLPRELVERHSGSQIRTLRDGLRRVLGDTKSRTIKASDLLALWPSEEPGRLKKREHIALADLLAKCGLGLEPDPRFGGPALQAGDPAVVFRLRTGAPEAPSTEYQSTALLLHLFTLVAMADGRVDEAEQRQLVDQVRANQRLNGAERDRLAAHIHWLLRTQPPLTAAKKRTQQLGEAQRALLGEFLISVAGADGVVSAAEVDALSRIYRTLGLDPAMIHRDLHALSTDAALPPPSAAAPPTFQLDMAKVQAKIHETHQVGAILREVFGEDEPPDVVAPPPQPSAMAPVAGLDGPHSALLRELAGLEELALAEFEALASRYEVLPAGALDLLNETALELCDESLCDGEDPLFVNADVLQQLLA